MSSKHTQGADAADHEAQPKPVRLPPVGFWSYSRQDDELSFGKLSGLRALLMAEIQQQYGRDKVQLFQDAAAISHGAQWEQEIRGSLDNSTFFIPIITPNFIQSEWCCREVTIFLQRETELFAIHPDLPRRSRIFPLHLISVVGIEPCDQQVLAALEERQWFDFRHYRFKTLQDGAVHEAISSFAASICDLLQLRVVGPCSPKERAPPTPAGEEDLRAAAAQAEEERGREEARLVAEAEQRRGEDEARREREAQRDAAERRREQADAAALSAARWRERQWRQDDEWLSEDAPAEAQRDAWAAGGDDGGEPARAASRAGLRSLISGRFPWIGLAVLAIGGATALWLFGLGSREPGPAAVPTASSSEANGLGSIAQPEQSSTPAPVRPAAQTPDETATATARLISPGRYSCQLSAEYRFRPCTISAAGPGQYDFIFPGTLLALTGRLEERDGALHFAGRITDSAPYICNSLARDLPDWRSNFDRCRNQPVTVTLQRSGNSWVGDVALVELQVEYEGNVEDGTRHAVSHSLVRYDYPLPLTIRN